MRLLGHNRGQAVLACLTLGVGMMATLYDGVPTSDLELHDGGVWVTNLDMRVVGHVNVPSMTLDATVTATSPEFDVLQAANTVTMQDIGSGTVTAVDSAVPALGSASVVPPGFDVHQGGQSIAISDPVSGAVWAMGADEVEGFSEEQEPALTKAVGARTAVGKDGTIYVVADSGSLRSVASGTAGWTTTRLGTFDSLTPGEFDLTAVGTTPVLLDRAAGEVRTLEETSAVEGADELVLQPPGDASETVALASSDSLLLAPLSGGDAEEVPGGAAEAGTPAPPVRSGTCTYAAWGGSGHSQRVCDDSADDKVEDVERLRRATAPVFRVNRNVVVLNNTTNGDTFLVQDNMQLVANWDDLLGQVEDEKKKKEETEEQDIQLNATRSEQNHPPKAEPGLLRRTTRPVHHPAGARQRHRPGRRRAHCLRRGGSADRQGAAGARRRGAADRHRAGGGGCRHVRVRRRRRPRQARDRAGAGRGAPLVGQRGTAAEGPGFGRGRRRWRRGEVQPAAGLDRPGRGPGLPRVRRRARTTSSRRAARTAPSRSRTWAGPSPASTRSTYASPTAGRPPPAPSTSTCAARQRRPDRQRRSRDRGRRRGDHRPPARQRHGRERRRARGSPRCRARAAARRC